MIRRPPRSTRVRSSAASDVYKRQIHQGRDEWMLVNLCARRPGTWIEVVVHQELIEGEEAQGNRTSVDAPTLLTSDGPVDLCEVLLNIKVVEIRNGRHLHPKFKACFLDKGQIGADVLFGIAQPEPLASIRTLQL